MTPVRSLLFSPTWGAAEPFVGRVEAGRFAMRVRHRYSNGLTRLLDGRVVRTAGGARLEGRFRTLWLVVLVLRLAWLALLLPAGRYLLDGLAHVQQGESLSWPVFVAPLAVPAAILALLMAIEAWARRLGDADEDRIRRHLAGLFPE